MRRGLSTAANLVFSFTDYTLKERLASKLSAGYGRWLGGFRTYEARSGAARQGFELEVLGGERAVLASKTLLSPVAFNKYGVNLAALEDKALGALEAGAAAGKILFFDELGAMAMLSGKFSSRAVELLFSERPCLVFCRKGARVFEEAFSKMDDTVIIELTPANWAGVVAAAQAWLDRRVQSMENIK
jgi:nucleoside-triphosphatase THEP1